MEMNEPLNLHQLNEKIGEAEKAKDMEFSKRICLKIYFSEGRLELLKARMNF